MKKGFVHLVGAGPGDPGLLTLRGRAVLEAAEVVIYDSLVHTDILDLAGKDAERILMGKIGHGTQLPQNEINDKLVELGRAGKRVVRLKGGDPSVFGRVADEAGALADAGVDFEIVPGITSASGAAAYAGIPLTHRDFAPSVTFITGHRRRDGGFTPDIDWGCLAGIKGTLVVYMGVKHLREVADNLISNGKDEATPTAFVRKATWPEQQVVRSTLGGIAEMVDREGLKPPGLVIIGEVATLHTELSWFDSSPLKGKNILVTRATDQAQPLSRLITACGGSPIELPLIELRGFGHQSAVEGALKKLFAYDWVIFTSANGVRFTFDKLAAMGLDARVFGAARVCAVGPKTAESLMQQGIRADVVPEKYVGESLVEALEQSTELKSASILIPRAKEARDVVEKSLESAGARVEVLPIYENVRPEPIKLALKVLTDGDVDGVTLASSSAATNYAALLREKGMFASSPPCFVIGPATKKTAQEEGLPIAGMPEDYTIEAMVGVMEAYFAGIK